MSARGLVGIAAAAAVGSTGMALALPVVALAGFDGTVSGQSASMIAVPPSWLALTVKAAATCPGLSWSVPAAIAEVESDFGRSSLPGVHSGTNAAGAAGPMQLGVTGQAGDTFAAYDHPVAADPAPNPASGAEPPSPYDPTDAVYATVRMLCTDGAGNPATLFQALYDYNHSAAYVANVVGLADSYIRSVATGGAAQAAVSFAIGQLGVPYLWGGAGPRGFDCSGLVQAAYASAGVELPRTAQEQFDTGPHLAAGTQLSPGELVFFGAGPSSITHVGIYIGGGRMIDAPHQGAAVRVEPDGWPDYVGATRPGSLSPP